MRRRDADAREIGTRMIRDHRCEDAITHLGRNLQSAAGVIEIGGPTGDRLLRRALDIADEVDLLRADRDGRLDPPAADFERHRGPAASGGKTPQRQHNAVECSAVIAWRGLGPSNAVHS